MNEEYFYIIDHKNSFNPTNQDHQTKLRLKMLISCTSLDSTSIGNEINKFFAKIIPNNNSNDLMTILLSLSKTISKDKKYLESDSLNHDISWIIDSPNCNEGIFEFTVENIRIIGSILVNLFLNELPLYKIKSYTKLSEHINGFIKSKKDMIALYNSYRQTSSDNKHIISNNNNNNNNSNSNKTKKNFYNLFKEKIIQSKAIDIPIELAFLIQKLRTINKINIPLESLDDSAFNLLLMILLNYNLFFTNCTSIDFDLTNVKLTNELLKKYHLELVKTSTIHIKDFNPGFSDELTNKSRWTFNTNHIENLEQFYPTTRSIKLNSFDSTSDTSSIYSDTISTITDSKTKSILNEYKRLFELCIIYPYFISQWKAITAFQLIFPNAFSKEVIEVMQLNYKVLLMNYSLFDFFQSINQLKTLTAEFNSIDSESFEKVMSLIISNSQLTTLTLSLFVNDFYYQPTALFKLMNRLKINIKPILQQYVISRTNSLYNDDVDQIFITNLMRNFEANIEELFWVLKENASIRELSLFLVTPTLISNHESYSTILIKFVFNMLLLLNVNRTQYRLFKLMAPNLLIDNRKFPGIHELFEHLNYEANNQWLNTLSLQMQFYSISNISNLITTKLVEVNIGDFDLESFIAFVDKIGRKEFKSRSCLKRINVSLLGRVTQFNLVFESLVKYVCMDIDSLEIIMLSSFLHLSIEELDMIYDAINYNAIKSYKFIFGKGGDSIQHKPPLLYYYDASNLNHNRNSNTGTGTDTRITHNAQIKAFKAIASKSTSASKRSSLYGSLISFIMPIKEKEVIVSYK